MTFNWFIALFSVATAVGWASAFLLPEHRRLPLFSSNAKNSIRSPPLISDPTQRITSSAVLFVQPEDFTSGKILKPVPFRGFPMPPESFSENESTKVEEEEPRPELSYEEAQELKKAIVEKIRQNAPATGSKPPEVPVVVTEPEPKKALSVLDKVMQKPIEPSPEVVAEPAKPPTPVIEEMPKQPSFLEKMMQKPQPSEPVPEVAVEPSPTIEAPPKQPSFLEKMIQKPAQPEQVPEVVIEPPKPSGNPTKVEEQKPRPELSYEEAQELKKAIVEKIRQNEPLVPLVESKPPEAQELPKSPPRLPVEQSKSIMEKITAPKPPPTEELPKTDETLAKIPVEDLKSAPEQLPTPKPPFAEKSLKPAPVLEPPMPTPEPGPVMESSNPTPVIGETKAPVEEPKSILEKITQKPAEEQKPASVKESKVESVEKPEAAPVEDTRSILEKKSQKLPLEEANSALEETKLSPTLEPKPSPKVEEIKQTPPSAVVEEPMTPKEEKLMQKPSADDLQPEPGPPPAKQPKTVFDRLMKKIEKAEVKKLPPPEPTILPPAPVPETAPEGITELITKSETNKVSPKVDLIKEEPKPTPAPEPEQIKASILPPPPLSVPIVEFSTPAVPPPPAAVTEYVPPASNNLFNPLPRGRFGAAPLIALPLAALIAGRAVLSSRDQKQQELAAEIAAVEKKKQRELENLSNVAFNLFAAAVLSLIAVVLTFGDGGQ